MCCCANPTKDMKDSAIQMASESMKPPAIDPVCGMTVDPAKAVSVSTREQRLISAPRDARRNFALTLRGRSR